MATQEVRRHRWSFEAQLMHRPQGFADDWELDANIEDPTVGLELDTAADIEEEVRKDLAAAPERNDQASISALMDVRHS